MTPAIITDRRRGARNHNMRILVAELQQRDMLRDEISIFLGMSRSAGRKYINLLLPIIEIAHYEGATADYIGQPVYRITDAERVRAFLDGLSNTVKEVARPAMPDPRRRFHIMRDDVFYMVKVHSEPVMRDALVAALFGAAGATA